jgi:hypothetical protein
MHMKGSGYAFGAACTPVRGGRLTFPVSGVIELLVIGIGSLDVNDISSDGLQNRVTADKTRPALAPHERGGLLYTCRPRDCFSNLAPDSQ